MKNLVLIDFTQESENALKYAIEFTKLIDGELEMLNVASLKNFSTSYNQIMDMQVKFSTPEFKIGVVELEGDFEDELNNYTTNNKIGFIFSGTHKKRIFEHIFSSHTLKLLNRIEANFIFVPENLVSYRPIRKVMAPIYPNKHSLQKLEALRYLHSFIDFELILTTYRSKNEKLKETLMVAAKLLQNASIKFSIEYVGDSEFEFHRLIDDYATKLDVDLLSIVNLTQSKVFNHESKGFVDDMIRNKHYMPILAIQDKNLASRFSFDYN